MKSRGTSGGALAGNRESRLAALRLRAQELDDRGKREEIVPVCEAILDLDPDCDEALQFLGMWHFERGAYSNAAEIFTRLTVLAPEEPRARLPLAVALEELGQLEAAFAQLRIAVRANPDNFFPFLYLGSVLERLGERERASLAYAKAARLNLDKEALIDDPTLPVHARDRARRGNALIAGFLRELHADAVKETRRCRPGADLARVAASSWRRMHHTPIQLSNPAQSPHWFYVPHLDRSAWFEREEFPWVEALEARSDEILAEVRERYRIEDDTQPYLDRGNLGDEWRDIVGTTNWGACHFYNGFRRNETTYSRFPVTASVLDELPLFRIEGDAMEALYSVLKPGMQIPAHQGVSNAKLTVHLPLVVPRECYLLVQDEARRVEFGRCLLFDDSFPHAARNDSKDVRIVLLFQIWHPDLREEERAAIEASYAAHERWLHMGSLDRLLAD